MAARNQKLRRLRNFLTGIKGRSRSYAVEYLKTQERFIEDMNRDQLSQGLDTQGMVMQEGYSDQWGAEREAKGLQTDFVDLKFTGSFHKEIEAKITPYYIQFTNPEREKLIRNEQLFATDTKRILGLTKGNAEILANKAAWYIAKKLNEELTSI